MKTATIIVKFFGSLRGKGSSEQTLTISENETIHSVVWRLSIEPHASYMYAVNGIHSKANAGLQDGDTLMIIPPISGG